jgi:hypothetical protein
MNLYTKKYKKQIEISEIDFDLYEEFFPRWDTYDDERGTHPEVIESNPEELDWINEVHPVNIERALNILSQLKENGCSHVEIMYHTDHIGYIFTGVDIYLSTKEEIKENLLKDKEESERSERILELQRELNHLRNFKK